MKRKQTMDTALTGLGLLTAAGLVAVAFSGQASGSGGDTADYLPATIELTGVVRDFRERSESNGHPDFERRPAAGFGQYMNNIADQLDADGKPVFEGGGRKVSSQWRDSSGRNIHPSLYDASAGDTAGSWGSADPGGIQSQDTFRQWYRDVPGVNAWQPLSITLVRQQGSNVYTFNDRWDEMYENLGGFFPINGQMFGNSSGENKNFHFTFELVTEFVYEQGAGQIFTFTGDDDVWVFIDGRLVIDIGGVHSAVSQTVDLDRLDWLQNGKRYNLHFFFAERHRTQSNFRIDTTLTLRNARLPNSMAMFD